MLHFHYQHLRDMSHGRKRLEEFISPRSDDLIVTQTYYIHRQEATVLLTAAYIPEAWIGDDDKEQKWTIVLDIAHTLGIQGRLRILAGTTTVGSTLAQES